MCIKSKKYMTYFKALSVLLKLIIKMLKSGLLQTHILNDFEDS